MIITLLIGVLLAFVSAVFVLLPVVTIATIPVLGSFMSSTLITAIKMWNSFMITFPYAVISWQCFQYVILFETLMLLGKFLLGHRMPSHN